MNPYPFFGAPFAWPRGFPLDEIRKSTTSVVSSNHSFDIEEVSWLNRSVLVVQSLADHDPDVDAIYRLSSLPLPFDFTINVEHFPHLLVNERLFCPYNAQATLHFHRGFWAMLLPISVHGRVSDIWRSYFSQRLFWNTGDMAAFAPPWVKQYRNPHNYLSDFEAEKDLYEKSSALVSYLGQEWKCDASALGINVADSETAQTFSCLKQLYLDMYSYGILDKEDVEVVQAWLEDLLNIGYTMSERSF
jgi:hypothetical protein